MIYENLNKVQVSTPLYDDKKKDANYFIKTYVNMF